MSHVSNTYLLDCHRKYAQDAYAAVTLIKAATSFAISFFVNDWLAKHGPINVFFLIGSIHIAVSMVCFPMFMANGFGSRSITLSQSKTSFAGAEMLSPSSTGCN
ncbi:MFS domain-containing protein [Fusarium falciforme]|uniref:MFS domain-containing protein n=1 Tax=Fusarium falciforme TaxID=195108 RepID=UPI002300AC2B|nr:MFS domain-containing protein [Fusarium falciforme]WAO95588.1 MFS domain-containing protein [Fusarium falciforme]